MTVDLHQRTGWIFDMDGTLTMGIHDFDAIKVTLELPLDQPILEALAGLPATIAQPKHQKLAEIEWALARQATAQPGAHQLLERLCAQGKQVGILTRNGKAIAHETLAACGLLDFFEPEHILSRDCCAPKPEPDGILQLLATWQTAPQAAVMVGDYVFDLEAGRRAGTATVYIDPTGEFPWKAHADHRITALTSLLGLLG
jgi:HAD superfamily hydrolase (TIGR01509 family)